MNIRTTLLASAVSLLPVASMAQDLTIGFSQIGSESGWRAAETTVTKQEAERRGIELKFADAQQKQENQISALRSFVAQGVDAILIAPKIAVSLSCKARLDHRLRLIERPALKKRLLDMTILKSSVRRPVTLPVRKVKS